MLINVVNLFRHVEHAFLKESKMKKEDIGRVLYELKRLQSEIHRDVVIRQQKVKLNKTGELCFHFFGTFKIPFKTKEPAHNVTTYIHSWLNLVNSEWLLWSVSIYHHLSLMEDDDF